MPQEVFKNDEDLILFGNSGNIFRKPFEFSNGFVNQPGNNNWIKITGFTSPLAHTTIYWVNDLLPANSNISISTIQGDDGTNFSTFKTNNDRGYQVRRNDEGLNNQIFPANNNDYYPEGINFISNSIDLGVKNMAVTNEKYRENEIAQILNDTALTKMWINAVTNDVGDETPPEINTALIYSDVMLFNRPISKDEQLFIKNNQSGSDPLSVSGLILHFKLDLAEILNNGAVDFVGVRNEIVGQPHGEIMNLPAGTLQEQLDYANANLFVPFIN